MKEAALRREQAIIPDGRPPEVAEPPDRALGNPAPPIAAQAAAVLIGGLRVVRARGNDRLNAPALEKSPDRVAVVATIGRSGAQASPDRLTRERLLEKRN